MNEAEYDVIEADYLTIEFTCPKCQKANIIKEIETPCFGEVSSLEHSCDRKKCNEVFLISIMDGDEMGEVCIQNRTDDCNLKVKSLTYECLHKDSLYLLHYIKNAVGVTTALEEIKSLSDQTRQMLYRLLYVSLISMMDYYLSCLIRDKMKTNENYQRRYFAYKTKTKQLFSKTKFKEIMRLEHFQNIENVVNILENVFDVNMSTCDYSNLVNAVHKRNDIIHKNSFDANNNGTPHIITENEIRELKSEIDKFTICVRDKLD